LAIISLYRRRTRRKEDLVNAVVREGLVPAIEREGSTASLLHKLLYAWWDTVGSTRLGGVRKLTIAESGSFPDLARFYWPHS
jgi:hypothetical protein